ncbi:MAG TPA: 5-formyltetrahydrofolate cyclo-ligase [Gammaproteobacteria bacterium]|jgi:5-formyltetrahydrofolate cyclo-ligase|nr:5-formyltetrahydrofolate cyclo-ligase [Gammaproteobacteria bacterium]HAE72970.1 5-formyltetrahydrofolate cyclo-ligase [Gammaproteobacteria bacterium]HAG48026.1 5-formyltetrahydrofolate cyclo-ligase [Gammaproteobacteria bacterium]HAO53850.1 5-formyltetrahydrofolate cyclo-ligase [Gammaproteobacteria bacterium]HAO97590.1 5-formyltetrahydrofolate cyclo-ligase [Gammaproteobacteria bacterium]
MKTLRQSIRIQRRLISSSDREKFAKQLLSQIQKLANFQHGQKIALYLPNDGEIDTKYIQNFLKNRGFSIYLPILVGKSLKFAKVGKNFRKNRFGINEPISTQILNANQLNTLFMPLVGFDQFKNRIGMGGGFYDRTLSFKKRQQGYKNPKLYGLAFDCQEVAKLNTKPWDVPLDAVVTPTTIYR